MAGNLELLRRIDEKDYLTEREHREFLDRLKKDLEELEQYRKVMCKPILDLMKDLERLEKQDKMLKLVKDKDVNIVSLLFYDYEEYDTLYPKQLKEWEYNFIKEVLNNDK